MKFSGGGFLFFGLFVCSIALSLTFLSFGVFVVVVVVARAAFLNKFVNFSFFVLLDFFNLNIMCGYLYVMRLEFFVNIKFIFFRFFVVRASDVIVALVSYGATTNLNFFFFSVMISFFVIFGVILIVFENV